MGELNIIFEDNHLIIVQKDPGKISQADGKDNDDLLSAVKKYLKDQYSKPGNVYLGLVHRLDKPVGGIMMFAKTSKAASRLSDQIRTGIIEKTYLAVTEGIFDKKNDLLQGYMTKDREKNISRMTQNDQDSKYVKLEYEVIEEVDGLSLLKVNLFTGRSHQIRVQLAQAEHPLIGDRKYGKNLSHYTVALWAYKLKFMHPVKNEEMIFTLVPEQKGIWKKFELKGFENG